MNPRQWKKACKKAAERLQLEFPGEYAIEPATGDETVVPPREYAPTRAESKSGRHYTSPPRGTPIIWERAGYYEPEWECRTALEVYEHRRFIEDTDWEKLMEEEEAVRQKSMTEQEDVEVVA